jgi:hypothetical protein
VEVLVEPEGGVDPDRRLRPEPVERRPLPETGQQVDPAGDERSEILQPQPAAGAGGRVEDEEVGDVHRQVQRLEVEEQGVQFAQGVDHEATI